MSDAMNAVGSTGSDDDDDGLLAELRALGSRIDPVPAEALAAARSAIAWRTMDRELAELIDDESVDARMAGVRSTETPTLLSFSAPRLTVEIEVRRAGAGRCLFGQLVPAQIAEVQVRHRGGIVSVTADQVGRFAVTEPLVPGPVSLRCRAATGVVETDWFLA